MTNFEKPPLEELMHYGVKGMRWGIVKKEDSASTSRSTAKEEKREQKALLFEEKARTADTERRRQIYLREAQRARDGKLSRRQRQLIVGGAVVAAYATYKFIDAGASKQRLEQGKAFVDKMMNKPVSDSIWRKDTTLSDPNLDVDLIDAFVISRINRNYGAPGTTNNCKRCTMAYEMSRRGFDVAATKTLSGVGQDLIGEYNLNKEHPRKVGSRLSGLGRLVTDSNFREHVYASTDDSHWTKIKKYGEITDPAETIFDSLKTMPNGARGELKTRWTAGGAHSMAWEIVKGRPVVFDAQTGEHFDGIDSISTFAKHIDSFATNRLDNVALDEEFLRRWLKNA